MNSIVSALRRSHLAAWLIGGFWLATPNVHAAQAGYAGSATLTFTIDSMVNVTKPGDLSHLDAQATFELAGSPNSFVLITGEGGASSPTPNTGPTPLRVGDRFSYTFDALGSVESGTVDASHTGWYGLSFTSLNGDSYQVGLKLDYALSAQANGTRFAASQVRLDYFDAAGNTTPGSEWLLATHEILPSNTLSGSSGLLTLLVSGGSPNTLFADVTISGNLEAAAVPVPAMAWPFLACVVAGLRRYRRTIASA